MCFRKPLVEKAWAYKCVKVKARALLKSPGCSGLRENFVINLHPKRARTRTQAHDFRAKVIQNYGYFGQFPMNLKNFDRKMKVYLYLAEDTSGVHPTGLVHSIERCRCTCILPRKPVESIRLASFTVSKDVGVPVSCRGYQWSPSGWPRSLYRPRYRTPASWLRWHRTLQPATSHFI